MHTINQIKVLLYKIIMTYARERNRIWKIINYHTIEKKMLIHIENLVLQHFSFCVNEQIHFFRMVYSYRDDHANTQNVKNARTHNVLCDSSFFFSFCSFQSWSENAAFGPKSESALALKNVCVSLFSITPLSISTTKNPTWKQTNKHTYKQH